MQLIDLAKCLARGDCVFSVLIEFRFFLHYHVNMFRYSATVINPFIFPRPCSVTSRAIQDDEMSSDGVARANSSEMLLSWLNADEIVY